MLERSGTGSDIAKSDSYMTNILISDGQGNLLCLKTIEPHSELYFIYKNVVDLFKVPSCFVTIPGLICFFFLDILRGSFYPDKSSWTISE